MTLVFHNKQSTSRFSLANRKVTFVKWYMLTGYLIHATQLMAKPTRILHATVHAMVCVYIWSNKAASTGRVNIV